MVWATVQAAHWPLRGDAALMHSMALLVDRGWVPYRDFQDINLPGAYLPDWVVMHSLGGSATAWRVYDLIVLVASGLAMWLITRRRGWFPAAWAAALFALIHFRDGLEQAGQRDLSMACLLLLAAAMLLGGEDARSVRLVFFFGLLIGAAMTIKPTALLFVMMLPLVPESGSKRRVGGALLAGLMLPSLCFALLLLRWHGLGAFVRVMSVLVPYHASLGRRSIGYLLQHSLSPMLPVVLLWVGYSVWLRMRGLAGKDGVLTVEVRVLFAGALCGLAGYVLQGKGYPYHRYPLLAFLLPLIAIGFNCGLEGRRNQRWFAGAALLAVALLVGIPSAAKVGRYDWRNEGLPGQLRADLLEVERDIHVSFAGGGVQCVDSVSGCLNALYELRWVQSTGMIYDEFVLSKGEPEAVALARTRFAEQLLERPPAVIVVTDPLFPSGPDHFEKLANWPEFDRWLRERYALRMERYGSAVKWGGPVKRAIGYRIYVLR